MTVSVKVEGGLVVDRVKGEAKGYIVNDVAQIGWSYDGKTFTPPPWDSANAPSEWHVWVGDKETRIGEWVEDAAAKRAATVPASITPHQMLMGLIDAGLITEQEALDASRTGAVPASIQVIFDALPTARARVDAAVRWAKMGIVERDHPLVASLAAANDMSEADVDAFFVACAQI